VLRGGLSALSCLVAAAVVVVAIPAPHAAEPVTISYRADLADLARLAPYPAVTPAGLPLSWQPVSSVLTVGGASGAGTVGQLAQLIVKVAHHFNAAGQRVAVGIVARFAVDEGNTCPGDAFDHPVMIVRVDAIGSVHEV